MNKLISIIIPVYNEEDNIERTFAELQRVTGAIEGYDFEFIFTDNHSTDGTFAKLVVLARDHENVRVARFARNFGFHKSVLTGYRLARGDAAIQVDADLQDPPSLFVDFIKKWEEGHDVVVGIRRKRIEHGLLVQGRKMYYRLLAKLDGPHLIADAGDFRLIDKSVIEALRRINDAHPYLRGLISSLARNQTGIVYDRNERLHGQSKFPIGNLIRMGTEGIIAHSRLPLNFAFYIGMLTPLLALVCILFFTISRLVWSTEWPPGLAITLVLILGSIGLNGLFMGILGAYIGRIYDQVRHRPTTVVSDMLNFDDVPEGVDDNSILPPDPRR
ncbi:MAG: glycosyltransferase [Alphaproteobacteria bacterium]|nr:glycosyltransferase [Alphaproteobacteria bacterium]